MLSERIRRQRESEAAAAREEYRRLLFKAAASENGDVPDKTLGRLRELGVTLGTNLEKDIGTLERAHRIQREIADARRERDALEAESRKTAAAFTKYRDDVKPRLDELDAAQRIAAGEVHANSMRLGMLESDLAALRRNRPDLFDAIEQATPQDDDESNPTIARGNPAVSKVRVATGSPVPAGL